MSLLTIIREKSLPMSKENLNEILNEKFMTAAKFSLEIENLMKVSNGTMNYIECIVHYCSEHNIEVETVSKLVTKSLKEKLKYDAQRLNFMKKSSKARLIL
tara:strand:- start:281 stop:583 length:303 start_codon:yes stop_codon:yes gene_type:complete